MRWFSRHSLQWRRTNSSLPLLSRLPSKRKTPPKLRKRRSTAQNPFRRWRLRRNRLDNSQCFSALPRRKCQFDSNDATVVTNQAISQLRASSKMPSAISANCPDKCLSTSTGKRLSGNWTLPPVNFISTRVWTELGKPNLQQAQWRYHSASKHPFPFTGAFTAEAPRPSTVMSASHTQFRYLCPQFPIWICLVGMLQPCEFPWMTCCFPKLRLTRRITGCELGCLCGMQLEVEFKPDASHLLQTTLRSICHAGRISASLRCWHR